MPRRPREVQLLIESSNHPVSEHLKKEFWRMKEALNESLGEYRPIRVSEVYTAVVLQSPDLYNLLCQTKGATPLPRLQTINFLLPYSKPHDYMSAAPKTRPPMSDDQLAKLAVAREKALAVRRAQKVEKLKAEAARLEAPSEEAQSSVEPVATVDAPPPTPASPTANTPAPPPAEVESAASASKPKGKKKAPKQADPVVVVEQSF